MTRVLAASSVRSMQIEQMRLSSEKQFATPTYIVFLLVSFSGVVYHLRICLQVIYVLLVTTSSCTLSSWCPRQV